MRDKEICSLKPSVCSNRFRCRWDPLYFTLIRTNLRKHKRWSMPIDDQTSLTPISWHFMPIPSFSFTMTNGNPFTMYAEGNSDRVDWVLFQLWATYLVQYPHQNVIPNHFNWEVCLTKSDNCWLSSRIFQLFSCLLSVALWWLHCVFCLPFLLFQHVCQLWLKTPKINKAVIESWLSPP